MLTIAILAAALALIVVQPPLLRAYPWLDEYGLPRRYQPFDFAEILRPREPKPAKPGPLAELERATAEYAKWADGLYDSSQHLLERLKIEPAQTTEIYIDGTTGKRIVPPGLDQFTRDQQLREMEMQIATHDRALNVAWGQLQGKANTDYLAMLGAAMGQDYGFFDDLALQNCATQSEKFRLAEQMRQTPLNK